MRRAHLWKHQEDEKVEKYVGDDECELQHHELHRPFLLPQTAEHYGLEGIQGHDRGHTSYVFRVVRVAHGTGYRLQEYHYQSKEQQRHSADHAQYGAVHQFLILPVLIAETEEGGLHPESEEGQQKGGVGIQVRNDPVTPALRHDHAGIDGHKQIVEESAHYAAEAIDGRIFC